MRQHCFHTRTDLPRLMRYLGIGIPTRELRLYWATEFERTTLNRLCSVFTYLFLFAGDDLILSWWLINSANNLLSSDSQVFSKATTKLSFGFESRLSTFLSMVFVGSSLCNIKSRFVKASEWATFGKRDWKLYEKPVALERATVNTYNSIQVWARLAGKRRQKNCEQRAAATSKIARKFPIPG